ncbi:muscle, skeletal receptor tyrosine-protein kinase-like [Neodiprion lecontei]|uniref:Muscle, skeletal receptor tyrosine-protein kinase-like n=1 Tax=Neodiprion lecontei TaxID=441921 RepID=A0A6J0C918_NEOLC|nr:muscle, skeletal receptor tyrosine-protein kinase-like [Neodiprion lecontei]
MFLFGSSTRQLAELLVLLVIISLGCTVNSKDEGSKPTIAIKPSYLTVGEGNPAEFHCDSSGVPQPEVSWIRVRGEMNPSATFENGIWRLPSARKSDEDEYKCIARNSAGTTEQRTILYITERREPPPDRPIIDPIE